MTTLSEKIDRLYTLRERKRRINALLKKIEDEYGPLEQDIISTCETAGLDQARSTKATVTVTKSIVPTVEDWGAFYQHIKDEDAFHLLERRVSVGAYRECQRASIDIPGVQPYEKQALSLRTR